MSCARAGTLFFFATSYVENFGGKDVENSEGDFVHAFEITRQKWKVSAAVQMGTGAIAALWPVLGLCPTHRMWAMGEGGQMRDRRLIQSLGIPNAPSVPAIKVARFTDPGEAKEAGFELSVCVPTVITLSTHISLLILIT